MCNVPWVINALWGTAKRMLPARDAARVQLFKSGDPHFIRELTKHVAIEQVPRCFGGESDEPWPYHVEGGGSMRKEDAPPPAARTNSKTKRI